MKNLFSLFFFGVTQFFGHPFVSVATDLKTILRDEPLGLQKTGDLDDEEDENFELRNMMKRVLSVS